jgi:hypothetical protein
MYLIHHKLFIAFVALWLLSKLYLLLEFQEHWFPLWDRNKQIFLSLSFSSCKTYPCNRAWRPIGLWDVEAPTFSLESRLTDDGEVVSLMCLPPFTTQEDSWYSFLLEAESTPGLRDISLFSISEISYLEFNLFEAFHDPRQRTQICSVITEVWWIICGIGYCVVFNVLHKGDVLAENFHWCSRTWNACLSFPQQNYKIPLQNN